MTALIIFMLLIGGATDGGASVHSERVLFPTYEACVRAAKATETSGAVRQEGQFAGGRYKTVAVCVEGVRP